MAQRETVQAVLGGFVAAAATGLEISQLYWGHAGWVAVLWLVSFPLGLVWLGRGLNGLRLDLGTRVVAAVLAMAVVALLILPFLIVVVLGSFERPVDLLSGAHVIPPSFNPRYYTELFNGVSVFRVAFRNSLVVSAAAAIFTTLCALFGAYAIARIRFPGRAAVHSAVMFSYMLPGVILLISVIGIFRGLHLVDTLPGMFLGESVLILPFVVWLMVGAFEAVEADTEHAARVDGCSRFNALRRVVLPLTLPSVATTLVFAFVLSWNEFLFAKVMYISQTPMLSPTIVNFMDPINRIEPQLSTAGLISSVPVLVLALLMQRYIIRGIGEGSVK